ncbi:class I SAM-dependent methyltransferase [Allomuricauda sp. SCSIO 65647]|uniref:class I SAM-dependent methyltransferase n=1 Tax=Allomuricauda sp. SCSIO 65647 TaxID=2908843 RepID=UPI001F2CDC38|nr:class I SAM-dependent methyltransferase [Muricauda sp. SCSIO 65647]UJH69060.1 class I SAM-dependent methyltransferase [Muricauda sp. SCSIO 65647]
MKSYLRTKDFSVSNELFDLLHDEASDMLITSPQPENISAYYNSESYISHSDSKKTIFDKLYFLVKGRMLSKKVKWVEKWCGKKTSLLDIGAGSGDFVKEAQKGGGSVMGVEPSEFARKRAMEKGISLVADIKALEERKFEGITLWHVLEHLPELESQIETISKLLGANGTLFVAVPNFRSFDAKYYGAFWAGYDVPRHLWHFSQKSIADLFAKQNMKVAKTIAMPFDAFYVSMLSEKYKGNSFWWFAFFWVGLWSNLKAYFSGEYSSLIYVLQRNKTI